MTFPSPHILSRVGIIGDVHGEATNLSAALSFLNTLSLQAVLCVGDVVDGPESVDACCELLQQHTVFAVRGNHDNWFAANQMRDLPDATLPAHISYETQEYLSSLPSVREFQTSAGPLLLCHGIGKKDMGRITPDDYGYALEMNYELREIAASNHYRFMVNGHTHRSMVRRFGSLTVINAGTLKREHGPCFLTVDFDGGVVQFYSIGGSNGIVSGKFVRLADVKSEVVAPCGRGRQR